jgi:CIC family chloride channel protein
MGTAFAGIVRTPMTSVIMIFEVTRDYSIIVPLMISNLISFFISRRLQPEAIYEALSRQDGIHLPSSGVHREHSNLRVVDAMRSEIGVIEPQATIQEALNWVRSLAVNTWPVAHGKHLLGIVTASHLESAADDGAGCRTVAEILEPLPQGHLDADNFPHVHPDHSLDLALQRMGDMRLDVLPVVGRANVREILGVITLPDVLRTYGIDHPR